MGASMNGSCGGCLLDELASWVLVSTSETEQLLNRFAPALALLNVEDVALRAWVVIMSKGQTGEGGGRREDFAVQHQIISYTALTSQQTPVP